MSVTIHFYEHPFAGCAAKVFEADCVAEWLFTHFGDVPKVNLQVYRGQASAEAEVTRDFEALKSSDPEHFTVLQSPGEPFSVLQVALVVLSIASVLLAAKPTVPVNVNRTSASPNNALGERENQLRMLQRVEDIVGTVRAYPSLLAPTYFKYINHRKVECGYYCVGRGYHGLDDVRDGDSSLEAISGSAAAFYGPFTSPNSGDAPQLQIGDPIMDRVLSVRRSNEVDGITLKAHNQIVLAAGASYTFEPTTTGDRITQAAKRPNFNALLNPSDEIVISMPDIVLGASAEVTADAVLSGFSGNFVVSSGGGGEGAGGGGTGGTGGEGGDGG